MPTRDWLRRAYSTTSAWLKAGGGPSYRVGALALWTLCSWDAIGVGYVPGYQDRVVAALVARGWAAGQPQ